MSDVSTGILTGGISQSYATDIVSRETGEALIAESVIAGTVWREECTNTLQIKFNFLPRTGSAAASGVFPAPGSFTDTTGMSLQAWSPYGATTTAAPIGSAVRISKVVEAVRPNILSEVSQVSGQALAEKIDSDLAALFGAFLTPSLASNKMDFATWVAASGTLSKNKVKMSDRYGVLHPTQYQDLLKDLQSSNQFAWASASQTGIIGTLAGVPCLQTPVVGTESVEYTGVGTSSSSLSAASYVGAMYHRTALGLGMKEYIDVTVFPAPAQYYATDVACVAIYGVAILDQLRGTAIISK